MAVTQAIATGDGSTVLFPFTFPYIDETDIKVNVGGVLLTTQYSFASPTTIQLNTAPATGANVRIYRDTDADSPRATFFASSAIRANDLNENTLQNLYRSQELENYALTAQSAVLAADLDMSTYKIVNLAAGTDPEDAVNKTQLDATQNANDAALASSVSAASASATAAAGSATTSSAEATAAATSAANAVASQNAAQTAASTAGTSATNAAASANTAASFAGKTIFYGYKRTATSNLELYYSSPADTTTYEVKDYQYKNGSQWYIGANDLLHTSGPNVGQPKIEFNSNGHLILTA